MSLSFVRDFCIYAHGVSGGGDRVFAHLRAPSLMMDKTNAIIDLRARVIAAQLVMVYACLPRFFSSMALISSWYCTLS